MSIFVTHYIMINRYRISLKYQEADPAQSIYLQCPLF